MTDDERRDVHAVASPDGSIEVTVGIASGVPTYSVAADGKTYVESSPVGFEFADQPPFGTAVEGTGPPVAVADAEHETGTETWVPEWGSYEEVSAGYESLDVVLRETEGPARTATLSVRVFDDGLGFRVVLGESFGEFALAAETTEFGFAGDYTAWWIPNEFVNPRYEQEYAESRLSEIPAGVRTTRPNDNAVRRGVHTPLTMRADDGTYLSVLETGVADYPTTSLAPVAGDGGRRMAAELAPLPDGTKVSASAPHTTPWRVIQVGDRPGELIESELVALLSPGRDDAALPAGGDGAPDTDWLTARKYVGVWWLMIAGSAHWEYKSDEAIRREGGDPARYVHGARTERAKRYMAFAGEHGIDSVLVEGWNEGWDTYPGDGTGFAMGLDDSYPDFDVREVIDYGASLGVELTIHNETAGNVVNYEDEIESGIFAEYEAAGIRSIKNGYVSDPGLGFEGDGSYPTHNHHCQRAIRHHREVVRRAAGHRQMLEIHEGPAPAGEIRTYPNVGAHEVVRAQEYDGFGDLMANVGRDHHVTLPFTRMLAGPTSYQPGIFDVTFSDDKSGRIQTTRAKQLAMYPVYLGGLQMVADRIEAYVDSTLSVGEFVQAPAGKFDGMITEDDWRDAFGGYYVAVDPSRTPEGASVSFTVTDVPEAGTYDLHLRYAADRDHNREAVRRNGRPEATLWVNNTARSLTPPWTDYWDDWSIHTVPVELDAGDNRVAIRLHRRDVGGFNLDSLGVSEHGAPSPVPAAFEAVDPAKENYDAKPEFAFVEAVPADWDDTRVLDAAVGEYVVVARRAGEEWFLGAMTDGKAREVTVSTAFLGDGTWQVTEYADAEGTDVDTNPEDVAISTYDVAAGEDLSIGMAAGGGTAMRFVPDGGE